MLRRYFSNQSIAGLSASNMRISWNKSPKEKPKNKDLVFGHSFTDHMLSIEWKATSGWDIPKIHPYEKLSLYPSAVVFHYGVECFEGMKAYLDKQGTIRLFRPEMNMKRLYKSCQRLALPSFDREELLKCIKELLKVDKNWIPNEKGYSLYIRPTVIATQESLGVGASNKALLFVICSPVGPYYKTGFSAVSLFATKDYVRAWPGGTGDCKVGGNYAPGIRPQLQVGQQGYQQVLWLFGEKDNITEVGTMNFFAFIKNKNGEKELVTPQLDGTILPGVTRDSILNLAREWNEFKVSERPITMSEVVEAKKDGRLLELFGAGTAAIVSPIKKIHYRGTDIDIPLDPSNPNSQAGPLTKRFADTILKIQYGEIEHEWSVVVE